MMKTSQKSKPYTQEKEELHVLHEAAVQYDSLRVILGGNKSMSKSLSGNIDLISLSRKGIKVSSLKSLAGYLGVNMETMSSLLHSSYRNIQRKDGDELLDSLKSEKVLELATFVRWGIEVIGDKDSFAEWVRSPLVALGNKAPLEFLDTSFGIQILSKILGRLEQGVYS